MAPIPQGFAWKPCYPWSVSPLLFIKTLCYVYVLSDGLRGIPQHRITQPPWNCVKSVRIQSYSGPHFPAFRLNTERYWSGNFEEFTESLNRTQINSAK